MSGVLHRLTAFTLRHQKWEVVHASLRCINSLKMEDLLLESWLLELRQPL